MSEYPEDTQSVLVTDVNGNGDNVMVYTSLAVDLLTKIYTGRLTWGEMYIIPPEDREYTYYDEVCYLTVAEEERARELAAA